MIKLIIGPFCTFMLQSIIDLQTFQIGLKRSTNKNTLVKLLWSKKLINDGKVLFYPAGSGINNST